MGSHSVTCHPTQVNASRLTPAMQAGTWFTYPRGMEGWVDLVDLIAPRPGVEPATFWSRVRCRTTAPPRQPKHYITLPSRSTQPSTLCGMVKWVSAFGLSNNDGDGGCSYVLIIGGPMAQVCQLGSKVSSEWVSTSAEYLGRLWRCSAFTAWTGWTPAMTLIMMSAP